MPGEEYDFLQSIQILALEAVLRPDWEATYRHICRWYSKTFATPLHTVEDLPTLEVLQHFFESHYEALDEDKLRAAALDVCETPTQRRRREANEAKSIKKQVESALETVERVRQAIREGLRPAGALGRGRPTNPQTVADLQAATEGDAIDLSAALASLPAAPRARVPSEMPPDIKFDRGVDFPEDFDALGGNLKKASK